MHERKKHLAAFLSRVWKKQLPEIRAQNLRQPSHHISYVSAAGPSLAGVEGHHSSSVWLVKVKVIGALLPVARKSTQRR